jgi:hypothetical protein
VLPQAPPFGTNVAAAQAPLQHCSPGTLQQAVPPQGGMPLGQRQTPLTQLLPPRHVPHDPPHPSLPQSRPAHVGVQAGATCVALCFLALLMHDLFRLPDLRLHGLSAL